MTDKRLINSILPGHKTIQVFPFRKIDTISSKFLGERSIMFYKVIDANEKERYIIVKHKNSLVVPLGAIELSPNFVVFLKVINAHRIFGFNDGQKREKLFYEKVDSSLRGVLPQFLGAHESLGGRSVSLMMEEFPQGRGINFGDLKRIIDSITDFHAKYYGKRVAIQKMRLNHYAPKDYRRARGVLRALFNYYYDENVKIYGIEFAHTMSDFIDQIDKEYAKTMDHQTLTHNDLTPRNVYIDDKKVIIYDWELVCYQNPEHDLVELLFTTVDDDCTLAQIRKVILYYRKQFVAKTQQEISDEGFAKYLRFNALEYCVNRLAIYRSYSEKNYNDLARRCERNARKVLEACL